VSARSGIYIIAETKQQNQQFVKRARSEDKQTLFFSGTVNQAFNGPHQVSALGTAEASFKTLTTDFYKVTQ